MRFLTKPFIINYILDDFASGKQRANGIYGSCFPVASWSRDGLPIEGDRCQGLVGEWDTLQDSLSGNPA